MLNHFQKPDKASSSIAAALLIGMEALTGIAIILVLVSPKPDRVFLAIAGCVLVLLGLLLKFRGHGGTTLGEAMSWVFSRRARPESLDYQLQRRLPSHQRFGGNTPPSVDMIRDLKSGTTNNWVPSQGSRARRG